MTCIHVLTTGETRNPIGSALLPDYVIAIGFDSAVVCCDGEVVLDGETNEHADWIAVADAEKAAVERGSGRWTIEIDGPLWSARWERQGPGRWICIEAGKGFA